MNPSPTHPAARLAAQRIEFEYDRLDSQGRLVERRPAQAELAFEDLGHGVQLALIVLPGGTFQMGSPRGQGYPDENPRHLVSMAPFYLARCPVTQAQWRAVLGKAPHGRFHGDDLPVENVSWQEAAQFCRRLSERTGRSYHLPSEAQWEYACRAETTGPFSTGETITTDYANYVGAHLYREEPPGIYRHVTTPVDTFRPNLFGLLDMHGNVWEYCADRWHADYSGAPFDSAAWEWGGEEGYRVARGGSWHEPPTNLRSAARLRVAEKDRDDYYGFRVALG